MGECRSSGLVVDDDDSTGYVVTTFGVSDALGTTNVIIPTLSAYHIQWD